MEISPSSEIEELGPSIGTYMVRDIPKWLRTADGTRHTYVGIAKDEVVLSELNKGESVIAPGLIYKKITLCWEGGTKETCDCPDCGSSLIDYQGE